LKRKTRPTKLVLKVSYFNLPFSAFATLRYH
jgi:hypothetical protein